MTEKKHNSKSNEAKLEFAEAAKSSFAFLLNKGFRAIEESSAMVTFKAPTVELRIYYDCFRSYEISCDVVFRGNRYSLGQIIRLSDPVKAAAYRNFAALTTHAVKIGLLELAEFVKEYGMQALSGDEHGFVRLDAAGKVWARDFAFQVRVEHIRPKAHFEFKQGNYREAVDLFEQILPALSSAELKRVSIAKDRA